MQTFKFLEDRIWFKDIFIKSVQKCRQECMLLINIYTKFCKNASMFLCAMLYDMENSDEANQNLASFQNFSMSFQWRCQNWQTLVVLKILYFLEMKQITKVHFRTDCVCQCIIQLYIYSLFKKVGKKVHELSLI